MSTTTIAQLVLSVVIVLGVGVVLIAWMIWPPHADVGNMLAALSGALASGYLQVINFWFQKAKDQ